jgi:hypothetical protein
MTRNLVLAAFALVLLAGAAPDASAHGVEPTARPLTKAEHDADRAAHDFWSFLTNPAEAAVHITIDMSGGYRYVRSDGIPDHQPGQFPNRGNPHTISKQDYNFRVPLQPQMAGQPTLLGHQNFGVALNGVPFDPLTAEYWRRDRSSGWNIEAMSGAMNLGLDKNNAHVQPNGAYHYHAVPTGLIEKFPFRDKPTLLGYAADGFPLYGPFGYQDPRNTGSAMVQLRPSHRVKQGTRPSGPGGRYDGTYVQDYEYVAGLGDLDACNGREGVTPEYPKGTYYYVITAAYPFIPRCWVGTPDQSFSRGRPGGMGGGMGRGPNSFGQGGMGGGMRPGGYGQGGFGQGGMQQGGGMMGGGMGGWRGGPPDLNAAAQRLGISVEQLHQALGPPPPDFESAAQKLGISTDQLFKALHPNGRR